MQYSVVINPVWSNAEHTAIDCLVTFEGLGEVPFTASASDSVAHAVEIFQRASSGDFGVVAAYVEPEAPPPGVPNSVTMRQARLALLGAGLLAGVDAAIAALPSPTKEAASIEWEYAATVERNSALVTTLAGALALDDTTLDALFVAAAAL